jgi:acyl-CoA hydrolase
MNQSTMPGKTPSESAVEMNEWVLPQHANALGATFGGVLMSWVDLGAAMAAQRHARRTVVTAAMDAVDFIAPIRVGQMVSLQCKVHYVGRSSIEVGVHVEAEDPLTGARAHALSANLTFVALGPDNRPTEIAPLLPETPEEHALFEAAKERREAKRAERASTSSS